MHPWTVLSLAMALAFHSARQAPQDLPIDLGPGRGRVYVSYGALRALPQTSARVQGELGAGTERVQGVLLGELARALGVPAGAGVLAPCSDGYLSVYSPAFIARYRPLLVLTIDGRPPEQWPPPGMNDNPGPYLIVVAEDLAPGVSRVRDIRHKEPWGVTGLRFVRLDEAFAALPRTPALGRELWINCCASCHAGPSPGTPGGAKAGPAAGFAALQALARSDPVYFRRYVRQPTALVPGARMEANPDYGEADLDALTAFLAGSAKACGAPSATR